MLFLQFVKALGVLVSAVSGRYLTKCLMDYCHILFDFSLFAKGRLCSFSYWLVAQPLCPGMLSSASIGLV